MKKKSAGRTVEKDDVPDIPELSPGFFSKATRGKYYARMMAGQNFVRIVPAARRKLVPLDPDVAKVFVTPKQVNEALRLVQRLRRNGKKKVG